ncbi:MAG: HAD hydrolase-like protein [Oscillospiraceae bacterium]|nr:HAD hydrolase-like protein [Oscillospiraceae bacterium]
MLLIFDLDGTLFQAKPVVQHIGADISELDDPNRLYTAIRKHGRLFPGVQEMLMQLHDAGHELVICSKSPMKYIELVLEHTGIDHFFTQRYSSAHYTSKTKLVQEMITPSCPAVVIGDTHGDISAAKENGLLAIAAMYGYGNKSMLTHADYFASTPEEIAACIFEIVRSFACYSLQS